MDKPVFGERRSDGSLFKLDERGLGVPKDGRWVQADGFCSATLYESRRLTATEIRDLMAKGVLPR